MGRLAVQASAQARHLGDEIIKQAGAVQRAVDAGSAASEVRAVDLMNAVAAMLGTANDGPPGYQLRAAVEATSETAAAFAQAARAIADAEAREVAAALLGGFAGLIEAFPRTLEPEPRSELAIFLAHELFLILIAALLRAGRWALLANLLNRHIFVAHPPGNFGSGDVPLTLLAAPGRLLMERGRLHGQPTAPLQVALLYERHGAGDPLAAYAPLSGLVDADLLLWLRMAAAREHDPARA